MHGVPDKKRVLRSGDVVSLDMDASIDGWCADATITVPVGEVSSAAKNLLTVTRECLFKGIAQARVGNTSAMSVPPSSATPSAAATGSSANWSATASARRPTRRGWMCLTMGVRHSGVRLRAGMTFCIEPMINAGSREIRHVPDDPWTVYTEDGSLSAHFEHTIAITEAGPDILTLPPSEGK